MNQEKLHMTTAKRNVYSPKQKEEILAYVDQTSVPEASKKYAVSETIIYRWRNSGKSKPISPKTGFSIELDGDYVNIRIPKKMVARKILGDLLA